MLRIRIAKRSPALNVLTVLLFLMLLPGCMLQQDAPGEESTKSGGSRSIAIRTGSKPKATKRLLLATTTSTDDSGLLDMLLPDFEAAHGVTVDVIAVGTGQALQLGEDGNADVLLVHARQLEAAFMRAGHGVRRENVMVNDFVIVGPDDDPADIRGSSSAVDAFERIAAQEAPFVSRGDESGTHVREKSLWSDAQIVPQGEWYMSAGQGMGAVLTMADEQRAYTLSDRATYLVRRQEGLSLEIVVEGDRRLLNPYGVIVVKSQNGNQVNAGMAHTFVDWLISLPVQEKIGRYGLNAFGMPLFKPDSKAWRAAHPAPN